MSRDLVADVLLPLVVGGELHVGRPWSAAAVESLTGGRLLREGVTSRESEAIRRFRAARLGRVRVLFGDRVAAEVRAADEATQAPDAVTLRLGAAVHNLFALSHPSWGQKAGRERWQAGVIAEALALASVGPPASPAEAARRHVLLGGLPGVGRMDALVRYWLGQRAFIGQRPPPRLLSWPRARRVKVETTRRSWLREVGVPPAARPVMLALATASPLDEASDPLRLDPPFCWSRVLPVLRFPVLGRWVAQRLLAPGFEKVGAVLADALLRFALVQEPDAPLAASPGAVAVALKFLAHLAWLDLLFREDDAGKDDPESRDDRRSSGGPSSAGGSFALEALLVAAAVERPSLLWPPDVKQHTPEATRMQAQIAAWQFRLAAATMEATSPALTTWAAAHGVVRALVEEPTTSAPPAL